MRNVSGGDENCACRNRNEIRFIEGLAKADINGTRQHCAIPFVGDGCAAESSLQRRVLRGECKRRNGQFDDLRILILNLVAGKNQ